MTTKKDISRWFDEGVNNKYAFMLIICDTFDYEDYPVYTNSAADCMQRYKNPGEMQRIMEVYNLSDDKNSQLNKRRCINIP